MTRLAYTLLAFPLLATTFLAAGVTVVEAATSPADQKAYLDAHNSFRAQHGAPALAWNDTLAAAAQKEVDPCVFKHSGGAVGPYGENLAAGTGSYAIASAVQGWTNEAPRPAKYDPKNPGADSAASGHFTQVVWKATRQLGCAVRDGCTGIFGAQPARFYACEYAPPGNVAGQYAQNVQP